MNPCVFYVAKVSCTIESLHFLHVKRTRGIHFSAFLGCDHSRGIHLLAVLGAVRPIQEGFDVESLHFKVVVELRKVGVRALQEGLEAEWCRIHAYLHRFLSLGTSGRAWQGPTLLARVLATF